MRTTKSRGHYGVFRSSLDIGELRTSLKFSSLQTFRMPGTMAFSYSELNPQWSGPARASSPHTTCVSIR